MIPESTISRDDFFSVLLPKKKNCGSGDGRFELALIQSFSDLFHFHLVLSNHKVPTL